MKYQSIADIYSAHQKIRERYLSVVGGITAAEAAVEPDGGGWSIDQIVEHVSIVEFNMLRICTKLIAAAQEAGKPSDGSFSLSLDFAAKLANIDGIKVEAPERVHPTGEVSIADSLERLDATTQSIAGLQADLAAFDGSDHKFPHPFFGDLTAAEWLVVRGGHEHRHTDQIQRLLETIRN
jgi:hypothetical protein